MSKWKLFSMALIQFVMMVFLSGISQGQAKAKPVVKNGKPLADMVLANGNVYTVNPKMPYAQAIAVRDGQIVFVGTNEGAMKLKGAKTEIIELDGKTVIPGLIDAHAHFIGLGESLQRTSFTETRTYNEIVNRVKRKASETPSGEWILGRGWDQTRWPTRQFPDHQALSCVSPQNPVWLTRVDGHAGLANAAAMKIAAVTKDTPDPPGGKIIRNEETGEPTGVFIDNAKALIDRHIPPPSRDQIKRAATLAVRKCLSVGLTEVHDAGVGRETIDVYRELIDAGQFDFRIYAMIAASQMDPFLKSGPLVSYGGDRLTIRSIKIVADGALGSRGAALLDPYSDEPQNRGLMVTPEQTIYQWAKRATDAGFQVNTHAIGDRANHVWLNIVDRLERENPKVKDLRLRDEHAQILSLSDIPRFAQLNMIPSMQPAHSTSDMRWAEQRVGPERIKGAYAWHTLLKTGVRIAGGSDFPVEDPNPLGGFYAAITRQDQEGQPTEGWRIQERMTREEALRSFTLDAAYSSFEEGVKGSIEVGKLADLVVLSQDIMRIDPREILRTEVEKTFIGGKLVYGKTDSSNP